MKQDVHSGTKSVSVLYSSKKRSAVAEWVKRWPTYLADLG